MNYRFILKQGCAVGTPTFEKRSLPKSDLVGFESLKIRKRVEYEKRIHKC